jgi:hypothetical protein
MNAQHFYRTNKVIFFALLIGMLAFLAITVFLTDKQLFIGMPKDQVFLVASVAILGAGIYGGNFMFSKMIAQAKKSGTLKQKTNVFNTSSIIRYALIEGPVLFNIVSLLLDGSVVFLLLAVIGIGYFLTLRPTAEKIISELELTYEERHELGFRN